jgi:prepilin-type N-terminal cleavage/methylation domain-containing protein
MKGHKAFTLLELMVVMTIIAILTGILFPVFRSAKAKSQQTACLSNFRNVLQASMIYQNDYEDFFMPAGYTGSEDRNSSNDRTWIQVVLPYTRDFSVYFCPSDYTAEPNRDATFDEDLVVGDTVSKYYQASQRSNLGYNYLYLAPLLSLDNGQWITLSMSSFSINNPSKTMVFMDSVYELTSDGRPSGGGSHLVVPPCRYANRNGEAVDTFPAGGSDRLFIGQDRWSRMRRQGISYGGVYPWHNGRVNVANADGSATSKTLIQMTAGCDVQSEWGGLIFSEEDYAWDLN